MTDVTQFLPGALAGLAARAYSGLGLANRIKPFLNTVITNVPGPQVPLYFTGAKMVSLFGGESASASAFTPVADVPVQQSAARRGVHSNPRTGRRGPFFFRLHAAWGARAENLRYVTRVFSRLKIENSGIAVSHASQDGHEVPASRTAASRSWSSGGGWQRL